jgi:hypothetical protein
LNLYKQVKCKGNCKTLLQTPNSTYPSLISTVPFLPSPFPLRISHLHSSSFERVYVGIGGSTLLAGSDAGPLVRSGADDGVSLTGTDEGISLIVDAGVLSTENAGKGISVDDGILVTPGTEDVGVDLPETGVLEGKLCVELGRADEVVSFSNRTLRGAA